MSQFHPDISPDLRSFIERQHVFFVATAPARTDGRVNLSPKGMNTFRVLAPDRVAYLDLTGSGNQTAAHLLDNGRITFMFCAFDGKPLILRLYGTGQAIRPDSPDWPALAAHFELMPGTRQIIVADITSVQTSCGYGVPLLNYQTDRDALIKWAEKKGPKGLVDYRQAKNCASIDGLPTT